MLDAQQVKTHMSATEFRLLPERVSPIQLLEGEVIVSPSPKQPHQEAVLSTAVHLHGLIPNGKLMIAPADLYLDERNVPQPDLFWVSGDNTRCKLVDGYWHGAPDLVLEVLSPGTAHVDRGDKFALYEKHAIPEYWLIDPVNIYVEVWRLLDNRYVRQGVYGADDTFVCEILGHQTVSVAAIFPA